ncbi:TetR/AcrR family transcriptional regulator [Nocardioides acrostichi]|uniref:Helix-turn-helix transcriptional regulator n=1 Tax=Nocardioides acrostichi TaxID=2784339 RepID=A0A930YC20_9ACTN|nr:TetR/AcrR family transcriptional regulator [Nocardioides acrostichi]MBF4161049.1 helix-turn-helix transcriptional regulator [Nocardioides acrostichi]
MARDAQSCVHRAAERLFAEVGFESASIAALSERSGVSNGSIYHHFGSKEGVLDALLFRAASDLQEHLLAALDDHLDDARAAVAKTVAAQLSWSERNRSACMLLTEYGGRLRAGRRAGDLRGLNDHYLARTSVWLAAAAERDQLPALTPQVAHAIVFAPAREVVRVWLSRPDSPTPTSLTAPLAAAAWAGLLAAAPTMTEENR